MILCNDQRAYVASKVLLRDGLLQTDEWEAWGDWRHLHGLLSEEFATLSLKLMHSWCTILSMQLQRMILHLATILEVARRS